VPELVKGVIALEPEGPPFVDRIVATGPVSYNLRHVDLGKNILTNENYGADRIGPGGLRAFRLRMSLMLQIQRLRSRPSKCRVDGLTLLM
jgi:hypothetical protein